MRTSAQTRRGSVTPRSYLSGAAMDDVDGRIQGQDHQQQDESRRIGFFRLVEVPGGGGLVDEVGQGGAGPAQVAEREAGAFDRGEVLGRAEEDDDDRGVADDPAEAEHRPGGDLRPAGGEKDAAGGRGARGAGPRRGPAGGGRGG